jgi:hypothetical protein
LLFYSSRNHRFRQSVTPKSTEQIDRPRTEPRVVVVGKCQNHDAPLLDLVEKTDPLGKIVAGKAGQIRATEFVPMLLMNEEFANLMGVADPLFSTRSCKIIRS